MEKVVLIGKNYGKLKQKQVALEESLYALRDLMLDERSERKQMKQ
jgi:hypothetical protein